MQVRSAQIVTLQRAFSEQGIRFTATDLESVLPAIARYLVSDAIRGWMFTASVAGRPLPYVVARLDYSPPSNDETGRIFVELKANSKGDLAIDASSHFRRRNHRQDGGRNFRRQGTFSRDAGTDRRL